MKKEYTDIKRILNDALTGFANKTCPLKVERKMRGGLALTHTCNFPCLRHSSDENGMNASYAILQISEYVKDAQNVLLPEGLQKTFKNLAESTYS
jgi:hypothetical protein